ncbi:hypothetical protein J6590_053012 [Homalodisca vitripennis]|nr:hypothetical protein J6590_053012 [Homalodisca vitripennis]
MNFTVIGVSPIHGSFCIARRSPQSKANIKNGRYWTMDNWKGHRRFPGAGDPSSPSFGILKELRSTQADGKTTGERGPSSQMVTVRAEPLFIQATPVRIGPFKETPNLENNTGQWQTCSQKAKRKKRQADAVLTKSKETRNPNSPRGQKLTAEFYRRRSKQSRLALLSSVFCTRRKRIYSALEPKTMVEIPIRRLSTEFWVLQAIRKAVPAMARDVNSQTNLQHSTMGRAAEWSDGLLSHPIYRVPNCRLADVHFPPFPSKINDLVFYHS